MSTQSSTATVGKATIARPPRHRDRRSGAWWLKVLAIAPLVLTAFLFFAFGLVDVFAYSASVLAVFVPSLLFAGLALAGWRSPGVAGGLLVLFAPVGVFLSLLGSTNLTPTSVVVARLVWFGALPLVLAAMLVAAAAWRSR